MQLQHISICKYVNLVNLYVFALSIDNFFNVLILITQNDAIYVPTKAQTTLNRYNNASIIVVTLGNNIIIIVRTIIPTPKYNKILPYILTSCRICQLSLK